MRELLELQTGQVAFISGLMSGFSLSIASQLLRYGLSRRSTQVVFLLFLLSSLLFLLALYVDVRLSIELAGLTVVPDNAMSQIAMVRHIGTNCATAALIIFILATGSLGWVSSRGAGVTTTIIMILVSFGFFYVSSKIHIISSLISA